MVDKLLNVAQLAELLCSTPASIRVRVSRRQIPHLKIGRRVLFDQAVIRRWLDAHRRPAEH